MTTLFDYQSVSAKGSNKPIRLSTELTVAGLWSALGLALSAIATLSMNAADYAAVLALL